MSDLVERLRTLHRALDGWEGGEFPILVEAADEIVRLQAVVDAALAYVSSRTLSFNDLVRIVAEYRALDGEP